MQFQGCLVFFGLLYLQGIPNFLATIIGIFLAKRHDAASELGRNVCQRFPFLVR